MKIQHWSFMKLKTIPVLLALLFVFGAKSRAQDDGGNATPVTVKITRYADNSYEAMKTDIDAHSAESSKYDSRGNLVETTVFVLDENGRAKGGFIYEPKGKDPKGTLKRKTLYKYDAMSRVSEVDYFSPTDQYEGRWVYHYDAAGKVTKIDQYDPSGNLISSSSPGDSR